MASGTKIIFEFLSADGSTIKHSYNYGDDDAATSDILAYMNGAITNGAMFKNVPISIKGAKAQTVTETEFSLS